MNNKVYLKPQIKCAPLPMESLLASLSNTSNKDNTCGEIPGGGITINPNNPNGGKDELSKEHWGSIDSWDSWE